MLNICYAMQQQPDLLKYITFFSRWSLKKDQRPYLPTVVPTEISNLCVVPLYFWYDKPHIANVAHYKKFVFGHRRFHAGDFIEDTMGHVMLEDLKTSGVCEHAKYGTWTLNVSCSSQGRKPVLRHVNGRAFREVAVMRGPKSKGFDISKKVSKS